ncbi:Hypothetical predicted protein [Mytilus galloprovincialis]|uniref:Uncharacterized protein n=1 Tax=Mytilus galloprovincialis TaxID=29158 RepID=A0A8B6EXP2_MYTGA|nr:Hypothetical predicted protein [Mytilus galloprovincialis]
MTCVLIPGIIAATEIHITGTSIGTTGSNEKHELNCFSCREPDGYNVEILLNNRTEDSITYNHDTGQCNHRRGKCHSDECNCTANEFKRVFDFEKESKDILYTCDMLFTDAMNNAKFSMFSSVVFNGEGFSQKTSSVSLVKAGDTILNDIVTEFVPFLTTQVSVSDPVISDNNPVENKDQKEIQRSTSRKSTTHRYQSNDRQLVSFYVGSTDCIRYQGAQNRKSSSTNKIKRHFSLPLMHRDYSQI